MGTIRFEPRVDKTDKQGRVPIRIIYQISGQRKYIATPIKCPLYNWDIAEQCAIVIDKKQAKKLAPSVDHTVFLAASEAREINSKVARYRSCIQNIETRFTLDGIVYTPQMVVDALKTVINPEGRKESPTENVIAFINQFISDSQGSHKPGTLKAYKGVASHLAQFQKHTKKALAFAGVDRAFMGSFLSFLTEVQKINNITAAKQISTLKTLINYARTVYKIDTNPDYRDFKVTRKDSHLEVITLTEEEFLNVLNLDLESSKKLSQVRDVFCFSCATGLRYSDLSQLKWDHIRGNSIRITSAKTGQRLEIPLNKYSAAILENYREQLKPLPVISNQKTNDYLKEICQLAGINTPIELIREYGVRRESQVYQKFELISIHTGRKTFTTLSLEKGIPAQEVMALTGHTTFKAFKRYVYVTDKRKQEAMTLAWGEGCLTPKLKAV